MFDGRLVFDTAVDSEGLEQGASGLANIAQTAIGNILANLGTQIISGLAQIPAQITAVGSSFEASMSQVAATMGITSASEEFEVLSTAAKQAGETTKFSATQAGNALNYLALAGYDANKAVEALPIVLNTAAAGGMDLAYASDLITDSMSALGLGMEELSSFSDRLAVTSQKSNTNVAQLGEAILTVGGTAKTLSGGVVEMNTALGILADNGIKGAEGGTALRNVILSLSAPTSTAADMLDKLNVTAFDAAGNMRPLQDTFGDLNTALSKLSSQEKTAALNEIFNKVDLKSVNALLGTSAERFDELSGYIENCEGAASSMADTMSSNLKGDITIMQSALEGLGVATYEKFAVPMRTAVQEVTGVISQLTERLKNGDLSDTFDKISEGFARLTTAAVDLLGNTVLPLLANVLGTIVDKADTLVPVIGSAVTALVAYKGIVTAATAAQTIMNAVVSANPYVLVASAIAALVAGLGIYVAQADAAIKTQSELLQESDAMIAKSQAEADVIERKAERYNVLYERYKQTGEASLEMKLLAEDLQSLAPETIRLIDKETGAYNALDESINNVIESLRQKSIEAAKQNTLEGHYDNITEYMQRQVEAERAYMAEMSDIPAELLAAFEENDIREYLDAFNQDPEAVLNIGGKNVTSDLFYTWLNRYIDVSAEREKALSELQGKIEAEEAAIAEIDQTFAKLYGYAPEVPVPTSSPWGDYFKSQSEWLTADYKETLEDVDLGGTAEDLFDEFKGKWEQLEFDFAMGSIKTETELFDKKRALLEEYGSTSKQEYWRYYKDVAKYDKDAAEELIAQQKKQQEELIRNQTKAAEELADNQKKAAEKAFSNWASGFNNVVSEANKAFDDILKQKTAFSDKLSASTSLFTWETATDKKGKDYEYVYLGDIKKQTQDIQHYADLLQKLKDRGASADFMAQFSKLDVKDGTAFAEKLLDSKTNFDLYMSEWEAQQDTIASIADEYYSGAVSELETKFTGKLNTALAEIPQNALLAGQDTVKSFIDGISELDINELTLGVLEDADTASIGKTLGERFAAGFSESLGEISARFADAVEINQIISGARYGGNQGVPSAGNSATAAQEPPKVEVNAHVYIDGKEVTSTVETETSVNRRVQGG